MLIIKKANTFWDYLSIRRLRNENRKFMTRDTSRVSLLRQIKFWWDTPKNVELYVAYYGDYLAGYVLLRDADDTTYITEAVSSDFRKIGVGTLMVRFAQTMRDKLLAEIRSDNVASIRLHERCEFTLHEQTKECKVYVWHMK